MSLNLVIERNKKSWDFKVNKNLPDSFSNNIKNNMLDNFQLWDDKCLLFSAKCQSVANYCWGEISKSMKTTAGDSINEGYFKIKCFVEPRNYTGEIHGIIETKDIDGQWINHESEQFYEENEKAGRWLIHSTFNKEKNRDASYAYSAGCFILRPADLKAFNDLLHAYKVEKGDIITGELVEV